MAFSDRDPNQSGRASRASNVSAGSRGMPRNMVPSGNDMLPTAPGVMSMLKTSTEVGDVGGLSYEPSTMAHIPKAPRRTGALSRMSTTSSASNHSKHGSRHQSRPSSGARRPATRDGGVPQYVPDTLSPTVVNVPGSSPLIPRHRHSRERHRSLSMTNTSQPNLQLSNNRSYASLRTEPPRPKSPSYKYPTRLKRPGYRPSSPSYSDTASVPMGRPHGLGYHGYSDSPVPPVPPIPAVIPLPVHMRAPSMNFQPLQETRGNKSRRAPASHGEILSAPPLAFSKHQYTAAERSGRAHKFAKDSVSSGSFNQRAESDPPSSDAASPPTPKDGTSMEVLVNPTGTQTPIGNAPVTIEEDSGPLYYDYSEHFDDESSVKPEPGMISPGFLKLIKTIVDEGRLSRQSPQEIDATINKAVELPASEVLKISELPASPVPRRITRELVLAAIGPGSPTEDIEGSEDKSDIEDCGHTDHDQKDVVASANDDPKDATWNPRRHNPNQPSILSQADTSVMDSSTLNLAVQCSIPMMTGPDIGVEVEPQVDIDTGSEPVLTGTEDAMSDLLNEYRNTESKQEHDLHVKKVDSSDELTEKKSTHAAKSSGEQSFKSCTNRLELSEHASTIAESKSHKSCKDLAELEAPLRDSDARSFQTCRDAATPERAVSMPSSRVPSSNLASVESKAKRGFSAMPLVNSSIRSRKKPQICLPESSSPKLARKLCGSSKSSLIQGSIVAPTSLPGEATPLRPPVVPPRESSSSKEAQRSHAVANFLMRLPRPHMFPRVNSSFGRKQRKVEASVGKIGHEDMAKFVATEERGGPAKINNTLKALIKTPEKALTKQDIIPEQQATTDDSSTEGIRLALRTSANALDTHSPLLHHQSVNIRPTVIAIALAPKSSSLYSPIDLSPPKPRVQSSPIVSSKFPEMESEAGRESQSTTHLVWHGHRSQNIPTPNASESFPSQRSSQDETTTDLRLSTFRPPLQYLPDLKEESHEDSSLNTSVSNLKLSNFRFPSGGPSASGALADDGVMAGRGPSTPLRHHSSVVLDHGLPPMDFSEMNLIEKLNEALDKHAETRSRSLDGESEGKNDAGPSTSGRPSIEEIRVKYHSFFASLDGLEGTEEITQAKSVMDLMPEDGPYAPKTLMEEIDELHIPSVGPLTQRLSELLPSFKGYSNLGEAVGHAEGEIIMESALVEINEVGCPLPKRSSARLRPMPGSPNMVVIDDALYNELTGKEKDGVGMGRGVEQKRDRVAGENGLWKGRSKSVDNARAREKTPLAELEAPFLRTRSVSLGNQDIRPSLESKDSSRSPRSRASTPTTTTDTRPWNSDKHYPWATKIPSIDISLPAPATAKHSPRPGPSHLRNRISESSSNSGTVNPEDAPAPSTANMDILVSDRSYTKLHEHESGKSRRLSIFTSKPLGNLEFDANGHPTVPLHLHGGNRSHGGERYPTSALTPPTNSHLLDAPQSQFSVESSDDEAPATSFIRRLGFSSRFNSSKRARESHRSNGTLELMQDRADEAHDFTAHRQTFKNAEGMPTVVYHKNWFIDRIKRLWHKSGDVFRHFSLHREYPANPPNTANSSSSEDESSPHDRSRYPRQGALSPAPVALPANMGESGCLNPTDSLLYLPLPLANTCRMGVASA